MTREDIICMAREAGFYFYETMYVWTTPTENMPYPEGVYTENLERFAALVAAAEREECAKVVETARVAANWNTREALAATIRARSKA